MESAYDHICIMITNNGQIDLEIPNWALHEQRSVCQKSKRRRNKYPRSQYKHRSTLICGSSTLVTNNKQTCIIRSENKTIKEKNKKNRNGSTHKYYTRTKTGTNSAEKKMVSTYNEDRKKQVGDKSERGKKIKNK